MSYVCAEARKTVSVPLINAGAHNPDSAVELIESGNVDFVNMGRALIADPYLPNKLMTGHPEDVRPCLRCNEYCIGRIWNKHTKLSCAINPQAMEEVRFEIKKTDSPKNVVVIGGGPGGMEAARELRKSDQTCLLVFTTTSTDHALEGFQVRATHYLVKPYTEDTLSSLVEEILARTPKPDKYITVKVNGSDVQLPLKDIVYAEHFSHMIYIHTVSQKTLSTRQSFENFTSGLKEDSRFFPCSRGAVVNLEHVADLADASFVMDEGSTVLISRKLVKTARQVFMDFLFQGGH